MKKTEWFPADVKPVRVGLYEVKRITVSLRRTHMLQWNGKAWSYPEDMGLALRGDFACMSKFDEDQWRGLAEKPE